MSRIRIEPLTGQALQAAVPGLAELRIAVFRDFPYLYDGDLAYEQRYLATFAAADQAIIVGAFDGARLIGAATGAPLAREHAAFIRPFAEHGIDPASVFYFAESVLLSDYRGHGIGHAFFDHREAHARSHGYAMAAFCAVIRPDDHPARPARYSPLDPFWHKRGFAKAEGLVTTFAWKDVGDAEASEKAMQFWIKKLQPA